MVQAQMIDQEQPVLQLPQDFLKTPTTVYQPGTWAFALPDRPVEGFQGQAAELEGRSLPVAAFVALLHRYTQQETVGLGVRLSSPQGHPGQPIAINPSVAGETTGRTLIHQLTTSLQEIRDQQGQSEVSLNPSIDSPLLGRSTFPAVVSLIESTDPGSNPALGLTTPLQTVEGSADLHLILIQQGERSSGVLNYDANLFKLDTIQRLAGHLQVLMAGMAEDLDCPIAQLPLLTQAETEQLADWSSAKVDYPDLPMHRQIEAHAAQQPAAIALTFRDQHLTYAELNQRANQLAHYLTNLGVGSGVTVAVCVEPSLEILIGLLAIFKVGGVYVPLDPTYPAERLATILEETQPQVLLTQSHLQPALPPLPASIGDRVFQCDRDSHLLDALPTHNPDPAIDLDATAYLVYTSGTTGKPKGVMVSHRNLINYIRVAQERFGINQQDVMPAIARFTFSITMFELVLPLSAGGRLVILEREHILDFQRMVQTLQQVTVVHTSPSLMKKLLAYIQENKLDIQKFQNLRHASCGGDLVPADLLETMKAVFQSAEIFVVYGCSEISCMGCAYPVPRDRCITSNRVGRPFSNVSVRLYDPHQNPVPIGVTGEIWFGGAGVTRGYLHREELTQEKFVELEGDRFYRTGDLGRFDRDGNLEILGRNDFQIQLRGMRIEPGEIEATLRQAIGVREAVVMGRPLESGELALVAYVVLNPAQTPTIAQLRQFLQAKLPDYMVPAIFMPLEAMPLTPNGKLDRRSLPAPVSLGPDATNYVAPRTPLEAQVAEIWAQILGLESVSVEEDFFALGGHSLLATQVIYRLREAFDRSIPISQLFESPTVAALAADLATLSEAEPSQDYGFSPIVPLRRQSESSLSTTQRGLWFLSQLEEGRALNIPLGFNLVGPLHLEALERSLTEIVRRHETLRTVFPIANGVVVQRILPPSPLLLSVVNLQTLPVPQQQEEVYRLAQAAAQHPFDLAVDRPLHITLLRLSKTSHVLLVTIHHIAADGWSLAVFRRELAVLYAAFSQGQPSPLADLPIQYADFVEWQRHWLKGEWLDRQLAYWRQQLAGAPSILEMPTDRPRPAIQTFEGNAAFLTLDADLTHQLKALSQRTGATLFMTLLAALATLLSRYAGQQDLVIGSPIANRPRSETEPLIGFFINLLALRVDLTGNPNFLELLQRVRRVALDAYANQDIPFGQVVDSVQPARNRGHSPLFQVMFILQNSPTEEFKLPGLTLSSLHSESGTAQYDLRLMMEETATGLSAELEYNRDLFDAATIARLMGHFQALLQEIVTDPARSIAELPLMSPSERQQMLSLGYPPAQPYPQDHCIHELFEAQVQRTPDAIALVSEVGSEIGSATESLTYRELNQRANQLAHHLRSRGVGPEVLIAIVMERSFDLLVSILAVLKAGGAYVPIDPAYSSDRQTYQLTDCQTPVILTQQHLVAALPTLAAQIIPVDAAWDAIAAYSTENLAAENLSPHLTPENLAYIIYTSGSTGNPKGVMVTHQGVVNHSTASIRAFELTAADRVLQFSSMGFDIFVEEVFPSLFSGATLVLRSDEMILSIRAFCQFVQRHQITVLDIPTAFWHELVNGLALVQKTIPTRVRLVVVGGEKASRSAYQQWLQLTRPQVRWLNTYGPTEATVTTTLYDPAQSGFDPDSAEISIGRAIANLQTYILDSRLQPVPIGVPGELHIGGVGLARGYLNLPEKSQEKFIPHPFESDPAARLYKTGDMAYYLPDGNIGFVGRIDYQVKIRGFRIELGEIEICLEQHPAVQQAVVLMRQDESGNQSLVAYVVTPDPEALTPAKLTGFLQPKLPKYMLPSAWGVLKNLPLTANGKVDRRALPAPVDGHRESLEPLVKPKTELESQLAQIWESVLGIPSIGVNDNFFDLGGHSLLAVRLWAKIEQVTHQELPLSTLFQAPTVQQLAARLQRSEAEPLPHCPSLIVMQPGEIDAPQIPLFCIHILGRGLKFYRPMLHYLDPQQTIYGLSTNMTGEPLPSDRVEDLAAHYLKQMQLIQPHGPYLLVGISFGGMVAFEIAQQLLDQGEQVGFLGLLDTYTPRAGKSIALKGQMKEHGRSLKKLGLRYLWKKIQEKVIGQMRFGADILSNLYRRALIKLLRATRQSLPEALQDFTYQKQSYQLAKNYRLRLYPGQATLFKALDEQIGGVSLKIDPTMGWGEIIQGGLEIHRIPGTHLNMLQEPQVQVLAEKLQACLTQFHTSHPTSHPTSHR